MSGSIRPLGAPAKILALAEQHAFRLVLSEAMVDELREAFSKPRIVGLMVEAGISAEAKLEDLIALAEVIVAPPLPTPVCRDPDDDAVLACALAAKADYIVTGDADLLALGEFEGTRILTAQAFLQQVGL